VPERGAYIIGLHLSHSLAALAELQRLNRALLNDEFWSGAGEKVRTRS
jgi:hypothetical protein